jgi:hypothetical protein
MPSRRAFLAGVGGTALAVAGGAVTVSQATETGRVYQKVVSVEQRRDGRRRAFDVLNLTYGADSATVYGDFAGAFADAFDPPAGLAVDGALRTRLERDFDEVRYLLGFEENGRLSGRVTAADFDRAGVGDEVRILPSDWYDPEAPNRVVDVTDREPTVERRRVTTFSLDERASE